MKYKTLSNHFLPSALLFAALCTLSGCHEEETASNDELTTTIVFNPTLDGQQVEITTPWTRVADIDLKTFGFTVCGYQSQNGTFEEKKGTTKPDVFAGKQSGEFQKVIYQQDTKRFVTEQRPWVVAVDDYLSFFAWSDNGPAGTKGITGHSNASIVGYPSVDVSVSDNIINQPDIVVAQAIDLRNNALISAIDLQFKHILSKISFKGYSSSGTSITIKKFDIKYDGSMYSTATYKFDPNTIAETNYPFDYKNGSKHTENIYYPISASSYSSVSTDNNTPATSVFLGNMVQIPQPTKDGFITAQVTYCIEGTDGVTGPEHTREVPINAMKLEAGHHYILAFDFVADKIQVSVNSVADWNEMNSPRLPLVAGPRGDVMLWLDGGDEPYEFNNEKYWLDRSGYNRHCKIVLSTLNKASTIEYTKKNKEYTFKNDKFNGGGIITSYIQLPDLGSINEVTVQLLIKTNQTDNNRDYKTPFTYSDVPVDIKESYNIPTGQYRQLSMHIYEKTQSGEGVIDFDYSGETTHERLTSPSFSPAQMNAYSLLTMHRKTGYKAITRNVGNNTESTKNIIDRNTQLKYGYLGGDFYGDIKMVKIINRCIGLDEVESDYVYLKKLHSLPDDPIVPEGNLPADKTDLIAYFDAHDAPYIISSSYYPEDMVYWRDRTGNGNHLQVFGYGKGISYDATNKWYQFDGNSNAAYMKFIKSFGALKNYWIEFYVYNEGAADKGAASGTTTKRVLIHCSNRDGTSSAEDGFIWYFPNENNNLWAYNNGQLYAYNDAPSSKDWNRIWGIGRGGTEFKADRNGANDDGKNKLTMYAPKLDHCYIGIDAAKTMPFKGKIKNIRVYSRYLSKDEIINIMDEVKKGIE